MHTAGIYADMTVDGPEIGTLVVIVDRAKNLPNRKSIGKQDPYCAARLGKEAKKTDTDFRGGQTPKWDQELRFTVHDSPDYYQLKLSVFNDDKKVDLIGEAWIDLKEVIVPGGGQNDVWHSLNFRGKYAGEVRIEITYYDTRPKPERAPDRVRQSSSNPIQEGGRESLGGPRDQRAPMKRRPLPADPTGATPSPSTTPEYIRTPPRGFHTPPTHIPTQSPLQNVEYNTPSHLSQSQHGYRQSPSAPLEYGLPSGMIAATPAPRPMHDDRYDIYDPADANVYDDNNAYNHYDNQYQNGGQMPPRHYSAPETVHEMPASEQYGEPQSPDGPPPPPPAHRSNHASPAPNTSYGFSQSVGSSHPPVDDPRQTGSRHSMSSYSNSYDQTTPPREPEFNSSYPGRDSYQSPPRHHSYDDRYSSSYRSMQPTVEDAPASPASYRSSGPQQSHYNDRRYDDVPATAPLNLSGRGSAASGHYNATHAHGQPQYQTSATGSPSSYRGPQHRASDNPLRRSYGNDQQNQPPRRQSEDYPRHSPGGYVPPVPPSLVAGMDPMIAQGISERIHSDSRDGHNSSTGMPPRNRFPEQQQHRPHPLSQQEAAPAPFVPAVATYNDQQNRLATGTYAPVVKPRAISPDHRLPRKSVSPAVSPSESRPSTQDRRLSGIPFGPDAYDALNPNVSSTGSVSSSGPAPTPVVDPDAKIIMHDGREVDPSDHLPEHTWAAEPEVKTPKRPVEKLRTRPMPGGAQPMPQPGRRPARDDPRPRSMGSIPAPAYMSGALSDPPSPAAPTGRNRLQKKNPHTPQMGAAPQSSPLAPISPYQDNTYASRSLPRPHTMVDMVGENPYGSYSAGSPGYRGTAAPPPVPAKIPIRSMGRGPPVEEKNPVNMNRGRPPPPPEESAWALLEEMKNIDLGSGRSRRRGQGHVVV